MSTSVKLEKHVNSLPTTFNSDEERFLFLKSIEDVVQQKYATERERKIFRKSLIRLHPKIFKTLFDDYQLSQKRKKQTHISRQSRKYYSIYPKLQIREDYQI